MPCKNLEPKNLEPEAYKATVCELKITTNKQKCKRTPNNKNQ